MRPCKASVHTHDQGPHYAGNHQASREGNMLCPLPPAAGVENPDDVAEEEPRCAEQTPPRWEKARLVFDLLQIAEVSAPLPPPRPVDEARRSDQHACER